jgi:acetyltransferase
VSELFRRERRAGRLQLVELRALEVLKHYGFPVVNYELAQEPEEAAAAAERVGYPVVMKLAGPKILHKTDVGAIELNVSGAEAVKRAFEAMVKRVRQRLGEDTEIWGALIQPMVPAGKEVILGMSRDPVFGPLLMFGLGGIYTEVMRDVSFRVAPLRENMAIEMVHGTRAYRLLRGVRGEPPSDMEAIADCLLRLSQLVTDHPEIKELDINPLIVYQQGQGALVVDSRIILTEA